MSQRLRITNNGKETAALGKVRVPPGATVEVNAKLINPELLARAYKVICVPVEELVVLSIQPVDAPSVSIQIEGAKLTDEAVERIREFVERPRPPEQVLVLDTPVEIHPAPAPLHSDAPDAVCIGASENIGAGRVEPEAVESEPVTPKVAPDAPPKRKGGRPKGSTTAKKPK